MTDPIDEPDVPPEEAPFEDAEFEVETERMPDGRSIHYYHWRDPESDEPERTSTADV